VRSTLLNLGQSDILLCQQQNEFTVIERFRDESPYAKANGNAEITLEGNDARQLAAAFNANTKHTLEFMASNQVATAQKVIWEQFPDHRPGHHSSNHRHKSCRRNCRQCPASVRQLGRFQR